MNATCIRSIQADGLTYIDNTGEERTIDFKECCNNALKDQTSPDSWEQFKSLNPSWFDEALVDHVERLKRRKEIGVRQVLGLPWADGPYIEFYTEPRMRFAFNTEAEYGEVRSELERLGWQTRDGS